VHVSETNHHPSCLSQPHTQITTSRSAFTAAAGRKVTVNMVQSATGVVSGGNTCGVAYLNSLNWPRNVVWVACGCPLNALAQIISHEVGHIFNLRHDGTSSQPYLFGLPRTLSSGRRWNAIMGGAGTWGL
jgi:hypothetical protein